MLRIAYVISIIVAYCAAEKIDIKTDERLAQDGYVYVGEKNKSSAMQYGEYIFTVFCLLIPFFNFIAPLYANLHFDKYYKRVFKDWVKDGNVKKIEEFKEELDNESSNRLKINNILAAKSLEEENIPKWKKAIANIYYQIGNLLEKHRIINDESNQSILVDDYQEEKRYRK